MQASVLKQSGLKVTEQRCKLLAFLGEKISQHLSVEEIYQGMLANGEVIGLNAVYRILAHFEQAGIVVRRQFSPERAVFELSAKERHDHFICLTCGKLIEFNDPLVELRLGLVAERHGVSMLNHSLNIYGHCNDCDDSSN